MMSMEKRHLPPLAECRVRGRMPVCLRSVCVQSWSDDCVARGRLEDSWGSPTPVIKRFDCPCSQFRTRAQCVIIVAAIFPMHSSCGVIWVRCVLLIALISIGAVADDGKSCANSIDGFVEGSAQLSELEARVSAAEKQLIDALALVTRQEERLSQIQAGIASATASIASLAHAQDGGR